MQITLDPGAPVPLYVQVQNEIRYRIVTGDLLPGSRLPSSRSLATQLAVAPQTILQAYQGLEREGLVESHRGRGTIVAALDDDAVKPALPRETLATFVKEAHLRGFSLEEIQREVRQMYDRMAVTDLQVCVFDRYIEMANLYRQQLVETMAGLPVRFASSSVAAESSGASDVDSLTDYNWIVTSLYSLPELRRVLPPEDPRIVSFSITYSLEVLARIASLPADVSVGIVGIQDEYIQSLRRVLFLDGIQRPEIATAQISDVDRVERLVGQSQVVLFTPPCRDLVNRYASASHVLIEIAPVIADESLAKIRGLLTDRAS